MTKTAGIIVRFCLALAIVLCTVLALKTTEEKYEEKINNLYPLATIVEETHEANNLVTVRDFNGNLWQFTGCEDWKVGDVCSIIFDSKGTEEIKDDEIISVRYSGWIDSWK